MLTATLRERALSNYNRLYLTVGNAEGLTLSLISLVALPICQLPLGVICDVR